MNSRPTAPASSASRPGSEAHQQVHAAGSACREGRRVRAIDDRYRRCTHAAGNADLLVALQKRIIEAAIGVHFALQDIVLDAAATEVENLAF